MLTFLLSAGLLAASALAQQCTTVTLSEILDAPTPRILVVGERPGVPADTRRTQRLLSRLSADADLTLAFGQLPAKVQPIIDDYACRKLGDDDLAPLLNWDETYGALGFEPYGRMMDLTLEQAASTSDCPNWTALIAAGPLQASPPEDIKIPQAPSYVRVFDDSLGAQNLSLDQERRFARVAAWHDHQVAQTALEAWDKQGVLLILDHRIHVEGGKGIAWQLGQMTELPVDSLIIKQGVGAPCYSGDRFLR